MLKLFNKVYFTQLYEIYSRLVTIEGKKLFLRNMYILFICSTAIIFIWYLGFTSLASRASGEDYINEQQIPIIKQQTPVVKEQTAVKKEQTPVIKEQTKVLKGQTKVVKEQAEISSSPIYSHPNVVKVSPRKLVNAVPDKKNSIAKKTIYMGANTSQVAITFDDGYNKKMVVKVLDVLKKNNIKSTFFIIGKVLDDYPEVWKRAVNEGHQICNHTNYHELLTNMSDDRVKAEIVGWETSAKKVLGEDYIKRMKKEFPYLRLPGGGGAKSNRILSIAQANGYTVIGWNLETYSSIINPLKKTHSVQEISNKIEQHVVKKCSNGAIILLHFNQYDTGNIEGIVQGIKKRGFEFQPVSQIIK